MKVKTFFLSNPLFMKLQSPKFWYFFPWTLEPNNKIVKMKHFKKNIILLRSELIWKNRQNGFKEWTKLLQLEGKVGVDFLRAIYYLNKMIVFEENYIGKTSCFTFGIPRLLSSKAVIKAELILTQSSNVRNYILLNGKISWKNCILQNSINSW